MVFTFCAEMTFNEESEASVNASHIDFDLSLSAGTWLSKQGAW